MSGFEFSSDIHADAYAGLTSLMRKNNGFFKSFAQARYWNNLTEASALYPRKDYEFLKSNFNVDAHEGETVINICATVRWEDYGYKSYRSVEWMFVIDAVGIVRQYKLHFWYKNGSSGVIPEKTELLWSRAEEPSEELRQLLTTPPTPQASKSKHVGAVGERLDLRLKEVFCKETGSNEWGPTYFSVLEDESGNIFFLFSRANVYDIDKDYVSVRATVREHITSNKGEPVTVVNRVMAVKKAA